MAPRPKRHLLVDADVLIDYLKTDASILHLAGRHVGVLHVTSITVAEEVKGLDPAECARLGLQIVEPDLDQIMSAIAARGQLSFKDHLCLLIAKEEGWECATNDRALRKACVAFGIRAVWGLELMVELVTSHGLSPTWGLVEGHDARRQTKFCRAHGYARIYVITGPDAAACGWDPSKE